jgi:hypothetical protein
MAKTAELTDLEKTLRKLREAIVQVGGEGEYTIFGSAALIKRGILDREPGDLDVMVTKRLWGRLLNRKGWEVETPKAGDPPMLVRSDWPVLVNIFFDWSSPAAEIDPEYLLKTSEWTDDRYRLASVEEVLRHKEEAAEYQKRRKKGSKHNKDIKAVEEHLEGVS